jgi:hypothetical protein
MYDASQFAPDRGSWLREGVAGALAENMVTIDQGADVGFFLLFLSVPCSSASAFPFLFFMDLFSPFPSSSSFFF